MVSQSMTATRLLDTSTLVAALHQEHQHHAWARARITETQHGTASLSTHTLAELYKVLTVHPQIRMPPTEAVPVLDRLREKFLCVPLTPDDYHAALTRCAERSLSGSVVFDALIAQAAFKAGAEALLTLNPRDFLRLGDDVGALVVSP